MIPRHTLSYAFASTGGCVSNPNAGMNGDRTSFTDVQDGETPSVTSYCYDYADRLVSTSVTNPPVGVSPVSAGTLTTVGPNPTLVYDGHGNTTVLADQTLTYDVADRHMGTTLSDGTTVVYQRDATGRIVARTDDPAGPTGATTIRYTFAAGGQFGVLNSVGTLIQRDLSLPGGASVSIPVSGGTQAWSYPNLHGDSILTADSVGVRAKYDPFLADAHVCRQGDGVTRRGSRGRGALRGPRESRRRRRGSRGRCPAGHRGRRPLPHRGRGHPPPHS